MQLKLRTKHFPHLLRNFPVTASGENDASNKEFIASIEAVKYLNFASKHCKECSTTCDVLITNYIVKKKFHKITFVFLACPFAIKLQNV